MVEERRGKGGKENRKKGRGKRKSEETERK